MTTFTIDNDYVSETLDDDESYTPAAGDVQMLTINAEGFSQISINSVKIKGDFRQNGEPNNASFSLIVDDTDTIDTNKGCHISGFVIN